MKKFLLTVLIVIAFVAVPFTGFAALTRFPVSREDILQHVLENTDGVQIGVLVSKTGDTFNPLRGKWFSYWAHLKDDGLVESVNALARRSVEEFEHFLFEKMRNAFNASIDRTDASLAGATCEVFYFLLKDISNFHPWLPSTDISAEGFGKPLTLGADGKIVIPEALFTVDLRTQVGNGSATSFFVSGILGGMLTTENEDGTVSDSVNLSVWSDEDILSIPTLYLNEYRRGKLELKLRGGVEEVWNRWDGTLIKRTFPDLRRVATITPVYDGFNLTVSGVQEGEKLFIDYSPSLPPRWEDTSSESLKTGIKAANAGEIILFHPKVGEKGFFQIRALPGIRVR